MIPKKEPLFISLWLYIIKASGWTA